ncbi:MAG: hypothetical protein WC011_00675 [Candidatus Paceibacterota bacterium]
MSQNQFLKILERDLQEINKTIDMKIMKGLDYTREARDHKLILKKIKYNTRSRGSFFNRFFPFVLKY